MCGWGFGNGIHVSYVGADFLWGILICTLMTSALQYTSKYSVHTCVLGVVAPLLLLMTTPHNEEKRAFPICIEKWDEPPTAMVCVHKMWNILYKVYKSLHK